VCHRRATPLRPARLAPPGRCRAERGTVAAFRTHSAGDQWDRWSLWSRWGYCVGDDRPRVSPLLLRATSVQRGQGGRPCGFRSDPVAEIRRTRRRSSSSTRRGCGRRRSGGEWMGNGRLWVVRRPLREDAMRPSGSGATGKRMGPAAECCARREGGAIRRPRATHQEGATPGSPWLPHLERAAPDGSTRGDDEGQEQSPASIASWRPATNKAFRGWARPAGQRSRATRRGHALAQPGRRAVLGGLGAPPRFSERPEGGPTARTRSPGRPRLLRAVASSLGAQLRPSGATALLANETSGRQHPHTGAHGQLV
jgi:hypothetical protein